MNIHLPAILMFTRGTRFWPIPIFLTFWSHDDPTILQEKGDQRSQRGSAGGPNFRGMTYDDVHHQKWVDELMDYWLLRLMKIDITYDFSLFFCWSWETGPLYLWSTMATMVIKPISGTALWKMRKQLGATSEFMLFGMSSSRHRSADTPAILMWHPLKTRVLTNAHSSKFRLLLMEMI